MLAELQSVNATGSALLQHNNINSTVQNPAIYKIHYNLPDRTECSDVCNMFVTNVTVIGIKTFSTVNCV